MRIQSEKNTPTHNAKLLSQWKCVSEKNLPQNIVIAELEKNDIEFVRKLKNNFGYSSLNDNVRGEIISSTLMTIEEILTANCGFLDRIKMLIAIQNYKPCGLLVGNMPKKALNTNEIVYSSRHNSAKNETELDWLATWHFDGQERLKGVGKALIAEYFSSLKTDRFRDVFVKSELPENSYAQSFYESLGFEQMGTKRQMLETKTSNEYLISNHANSSDRVLPMIITRQKLQTCLETLSKKMFRQRFIKTSVDIEELMNI